MERPQRQERDINELLVNGFFKTARGKSPSASTPTTSNAPSFLTASKNDARRDRSGSRGSRRPRPPRPTVEDEAESLAKESSTSSNSSVVFDEPPVRGIIDQHPIILEADISAAEAARLHAAPYAQDGDDNSERRFVLIPRSDTYSPNKEDEVYPINSSRETRGESGAAKSDRKESVRRDDENLTSQRPSRERRRSRQDLPALETKETRDIPPKFRRSASAYECGARGSDENPVAQTPRTPSNEFFLSPSVSNRHSKDYFGTQPRYSHGNDKRVIGGSVSGNSRPPSPISDKRNSGGFKKRPRSRRNTNELLSRPQQQAEEPGSRKSDRHPSTHSDRLSGSDNRRSSRSPGQFNSNPHSSSDENIADSGSDKERRRRRYQHDIQKGVRQESGHRPSPSRSNRSSVDVKLNPKFAAHVPSPKVSPSQIPRGDAKIEKSDTFPQSRDNRRPHSRPVSPFSDDSETPRASDRLNPLDAATLPRQKAGPSNTTPKPPPSPWTTGSTGPTGPPGHSHHASVPIMIPPRNDVNALNENRRSESVAQTGENRLPNTKSAPNTAWQPSTFQPRPSNFQKPMGSYRRHSEDMEVGAIAPLPPCPRTSFSRGRTDWLTLPKCPSFNICPSCFNSTIAPTEFRSHFVASPRLAPDAEVQCDFGSSPWYRIAWLLTLKERRRDLKLFYGLANTGATVQPCLGKHEAVRQWHSIIDPKVGTPIKNFDVCYSCVKSIETLLPAIRGLFVGTDSLAPQGVPRVCDLRFDSKRFIQYFDALETTADNADDLDEEPDVRDLASLVRRLAMIDECQQDMDLSDRRWHVITQLPEFTVCEECFDEVVWPELDEDKAIPAMFNKNLQRIPKASCQLYSPKMRGIFQKAVDSNDYKMLASKARERKTIETAYKANMVEVKRQSRNNPQAAAKEIARLTEEWKRWE